MLANELDVFCLHFIPKPVQVFHHHSTQIIAIAII